MILLELRHDITSIRLDLQTISTLTSVNYEGQIVAQNEFRNFLNAYHQLSAKVDKQINALSSMEQRLPQQIGRLPQPQLNYGRHISPLSSQSSILHPIPPGDVVAISSPGPLGHSRIGQQSVLCRQNRSCACHLQKKVITPELLKGYLGRLFLATTGISLFGSKCGKHDCETTQATQISIEYWLPTIYLHRIVRIYLAIDSIGPQFGLDFLRRIPDTAEAIVYTLAGNIDGLKELFKRGLASPKDVSTIRGYSLLRVSCPLLLKFISVENCSGHFMHSSGLLQNFFFMQGLILTIGETSVYLRPRLSVLTSTYSPIDHLDHSPREKAYDYLLCGHRTKEVEETLLCLSPGGNWLNEGNYTLLHKIVLGLSTADLEETLLLLAAEINAIDVQGRTALIWAAAKGDSRAVALLLSHGADPNIFDTYWRSALWYAVKQNQLPILQSLLEAGAATDPVLPKGIRMSSALNRAARHGCDSLVLKTLLEYKADPEASGIERITPLMHTSRTDNAESTLLLLEYGADINATIATGRTALFTAIMFNSHNVLRVFLERMDDNNTLPPQKLQELLETTAIFADPKTIEILAAHCSMFRNGMPYDLEKCMNLYERRSNVADEDIAIFRKLLAILDVKEPASQEVSQQICQRELHHVDQDDPDWNEQFEDALETLEGIDAVEAG